MADNEITTNEPTTPEVEPEIFNEGQDNSVIKQMRKEFAKEKQTRVKLEKEIEAIKQAELDKTKTLEEKALEAQTKAVELQKEIEVTKRRHILEKELVKSNVNPEFVDLLLREVQTMDVEESSEIVVGLQNKYPLAFSKAEEVPKPIGKIGINQTTSNSMSTTVDEAIRKLSDPNIPYDPELAKIVDAAKRSKN